MLELMRARTRWDLPAARLRPAGTEDRLTLLRTRARDVTRSGWFVGVLGGVLSPLLLLAAFLLLG